MSDCVRLSLGTGPGVFSRSGTTGVRAYFPCPGGSGMDWFETQCATASEADELVAFLRRELMRCTNTATRLKGHCCQQHMRDFLVEQLAAWREHVLLRQNPKDGRTKFTRRQVGGRGSCLDDPRAPVQIIIDTEQDRDFFIRLQLARIAISLIDFQRDENENGLDRHALKDFFLEVENAVQTAEELLKIEKAQDRDNGMSLFLV